MANLEAKLGEKYSDFRAMLLAYHLAEQGVGFVEPNPPVGCVILDASNHLIGFGYHQAYGQGHAEVQAVQSVVDRSLLKNSRVFVTLEPCGHQGKTPPCSDMLAKHKIGELIYAVSDPSPLFHHRGLEVLRQAGVNIQQFNESADLLNKMHRLVDVYMHNLNHKTSFVSQKFASSLDGKIALKNGQSQWITGKESRRFTHFLRASHDAILVGVKTLLTDDPSLNIRHERFTGKKNKVIILDPSFKSNKFLKTSKLGQEHSPENIFIACHKDVIPKVNIEGFNYIPCLSADDGLFVWNELLKATKALGISSILVEGGACTHSSLLAQKASNRIYAFIAPSIIGGQAGVGWSDHFLVTNLNEKLELAPPEITKLGSDILFKTYRLS